MYPKLDGDTKGGGGETGWDPRLTEARNPRTEEIDRADARTIVHRIQAEDRAVLPAVESQADAIAAVIDDVAARFRIGGRLVYVGAGTSGRLGVLDASECPPTFGTPPSRVRGLIAGGHPALVESSEGSEDDPEGGAAAVAGLDVGEADFVLGIATSGTTPYAHGALAEAARRGAGTGFLCCSTPPAAIRHLVQHLITPLVGPEVIAGSTRLKAGTATKLVLNTISTGAMIRSGRVYRNLMVDLRARSAKLVDRSLRIVSHVTDLDRESARRLLIDAGGEVKTALAMHLLEADRWTAERCLDAVDGFLADAVGRFAGEARPEYGVYPPRPRGPVDAGLLDRLAGAPGRLSDAVERQARATVTGNRVRAKPDGWTPARHVAHLLQFEEEAIGPRVARWVEPRSGDIPSFAEWTPRDSAPAASSTDEALDRFAAARRATLAALAEAGPAALEHEARFQRETVTLYQFLRGVDTHDASHERRIRERVHPNLLLPVVSP